MRGIFDNRQLVYNAIEAGRIDRYALDLLLQDGEPAGEEAVLWDYKLEVPITPTVRQNKSSQDARNAKMAELVKDAVAFYNSYGGYLVVGVRDKGREIVGFSGDFDAADLNKRIKGATDVSVETVYRSIDIGDILPGYNLGLLFIPRRKVGERPAQFKKDAPESDQGARAYRKGSFYRRERDQCIPAESPEDYEFLYGSRELGYTLVVSDFIDNNLPARDQEFTSLIGREEHISTLWSWLSDSFSPIKILSGLGGVGKTSIAFTFAERLIFKRGTLLDRVIWLGAKTETYSGELDRFVAVARTDFNDVDQLLESILLETGCPREQIPDSTSRDDLLELCVEHLASHRYLLIVDNVDSMPDDEQQLVFHLLTQICASSRTKAIITARRNLGAHRSYYIEVNGLEIDEFSDFVVEKMKLLGLSGTISDSNLAQFHEDSAGSPLFALSVLRLVAAGDPLKSALKHWKGSDGESVRDAAFRREIGRLKRNEAACLLALCYVDSASIIQLSAMVGLNRFEVQKAIDELRAFSMTEMSTDLEGGASYSIPSTLSLMRRPLEERVPDHEEIADRCNEYVALAKNKKPFVGEAVKTAVALMAIGKCDAGRALVEEALTSLPDDPDLLCLLGRCHQTAGNEAAAHEVLSRAYDLGCRKRELFVHWIASAEARDDWRTAADLAQKGELESGLCWFKSKRLSALLRIGDDRARIGDYRAAIEIYEGGLDDVVRGLRSYQDPSDRSTLYSLRETLAVRWLGAVQMSARQQNDDERRLFGAYCRAILTYKLRREKFVVDALSTLGHWIARVEARRTLSITAEEHVGDALARLKRLESGFASPPSFPPGVEAKFETLAAPLRVRLLRILSR